MFAYGEMDIGVKTSGRMFYNVVQIRFDTSLYSQFIALQRAHVFIAGFRLKLTCIS